VPTPPQNSTPLIRQHRRHSCNKKSKKVKNTTTSAKLKTKLKTFKLKKKTYGYNPMAAEEDHALPDTHNDGLQAHSGQMSSQEIPAVTRQEPGIQRQEEEEPRPPQQAPHTLASPFTTFSASSKNRTASLAPG
jgi:hypothetical protein